jgi:putative DNA primase/helicase
MSVWEAAPPAALPAPTPIADRDMLPPFASEQKPIATLTSLAEIEPRSVRYLWDGRVPLGMLSMIQGIEGVGKSHVTIDIASRISRGTPLPFSARPAGARNVILAAEEDADHETIRPRVDAAGGDPARIRLIRDVRGRRLELPRDLADLETVIRNEDAEAMIIDPITGYTGTADSNSNTEVRAAIAGLAGVAERTGAAILMVNHIRKSGGVTALHRGVGSVAFTALSRSVMMILEDPDRPGGGILTWPKLSVGPRPESLRWRIEREHGALAARVVWDELPCDLTADDIIGQQEEARREPGALGQAIEWLREQLADGPVPSRDIEERAKDIHNPKAIERARKAIGVVRRKVGRAWFVSLPGSTSTSLPRGGDVDVVGLVGVAKEEDRQDRQDRQDPHMGEKSIFPETAPPATGTDGEVFA